jgi:hypothetical protein
VSWGRDRGRRRLGRPVGCLVWLIALLVLLIVLSALFGGFQKGTRVSGAPRSYVRQAAVTARR